MTFMLVLLVVFAGISFYLGRRRGARSRSKSQQRQLPRQWPLNPRPLVNLSERRVWSWLQEVFPDYHIMVKLPVTRFTAQRKRGAASDWFQVLSTAYCTFTICNPDGQVIGCVDVPGPQGISSGNHYLKQSLLGQCGIGYWALAPDELPASEVLRADFLEDAHPSGSASGNAALSHFEETAMHLHEILGRSRSARSRAMGLRPNSDFAGRRTPWSQPDSFLGKLDGNGRLREEENPPARRGLKFAN